MISFWITLLSLCCRFWPPSWRPLSFKIAPKRANEFKLTPSFFHLRSLPPFWDSPDTDCTDFGHRFHRFWTDFGPHLEGCFNHFESSSSTFRSLFLSRSFFFSLTFAFSSVSLPLLFFLSMFAYRFFRVVLFFVFASVSFFSFLFPSLVFSFSFLLFSPCSVFPFANMNPEARKIQPSSGLDYRGLINR